jgi:predicted aspartyl protease
MKQFAVLFLAALLSACLHAEAPCPASVKALPFHNSQQHEMVVQVFINHSGPYDFLLDTGTQVTVLDQALAAELHIRTAGNANVAGMSLGGDTKLAHLDALKVGGHELTNQGVLVYDMKNLQSAGFAIRGLLGDDFLSRFDVLIDHAHSVLCIDDTGSMEAGANSTAPRPSSK